MVPAAVSPLGPEVNDPIRCFDNIQVMLDHNQRIATASEFMNDFEELLDVKNNGGRWVGSSKM